MISGIKAVAFDIDGTLYPNYRLYCRMPVYFLKNIKFYINYNKVRKDLHRTAPLGDFYEYQARLLAGYMKISPEEAKTLINKVTYEGLKPYFAKVKPFKGSVETIRDIKNAGYKIGILSDFPPEQKGDIWGIKEMCDVCIGSEEAGSLKPSLYPFGILAQKLELKPEEILYVGNSIHCDVKGAENAGMKSAFILTGWRKLFNAKPAGADFSFRNYRQLRKIVLE